MSRQEQHWISGFGTEIVTKFHSIFADFRKRLVVLTDCLVTQHIAAKVLKKTEFHLSKTSRSVSFIQLKITFLRTKDEQNICFCWKYEVEGSLKVLVNFIHFSRMAEANSKILDIDGSLMEGVSVTFVLQRHIKQLGHFIGCTPKFCINLICDFCRVVKFWETLSRLAAYWTER